MNARWLLCAGGLVVLSSVACGLLGDGEVALEKQEAFTATICACPDLACLETAQQEYAQWMVDHGMDVAAAAADHGDRLARAVEAMEHCQRRLAEAAPSAGGEETPTP